MEKDEFWLNEERANLKIKEYTELKKEIEEFEQIEKEFENGNFGKVEKLLEQKEISTFLNGKYDKLDAILEIYAGAGGKDAQDWAAMLKRMYEKFAQKKGMKVKVIDVSFGEGVGPKGRVGIKSCTLEIAGKYAFGILKQERGVHRLVRISPFSKKKLRHTSFALVEVLPKMEKEKIKIKEDELKYEFFKSSGRGGQYVNKRMSGVRITHLPTGIQVTCQSERSQLQNKEKALEILFSKLSMLKERELKMEISKLKGEKISPEFGRQKRSFILDPYKLVKDHQTKVEEKNVESVLEGNLDKFILAEIYQHGKV